MKPRGASKHANRDLSSEYHFPSIFNSKDTKLLSRIVCPLPALDFPVARRFILNLVNSDIVRDTFFAATVDKLMSCHTW